MEEFAKILIETSQDFINNYPQRVELFINENEALNEEYAQQLLDIFENILFDCENPEAAFDGFGASGQYFFLSVAIIKKIGSEKFYYSLKRKIDYLKGLIAENKTQNSQQKELTYRQVALIFQYENRPLTEGIAANVIKEGKYPNIKSAKKLAIEYRKFNTPNQRCGNGYQTKTDIRTILPYLSNDAKLLAESELEKAIVNQSKKNIE